VLIEFCCSERPELQVNAVLQFLGQILFKQLLHNLLITTSACTVFAITVSTHEEQYPCIGLVMTGPQYLTFERKSSSTEQLNMPCHNKRKTAVRVLLGVLMKGTEWKVPPQSRQTCPATTKEKQQ
jgi:hypothetical protein